MTTGLVEFLLTRIAEDEEAARRAFEADEQVAGAIVAYQWWRYVRQMTIAISQLLAGGPAATVQDVLLQQGEEGLHDGVVSGGGDLAHGSDQVVAGELARHLP